MSLEAKTLAGLDDGSVSAIKTSGSISMHGTDPVVQATKISDPAAPAAVTAVAIGDLTATQNTGWGAGAEADFDKIATELDKLVTDVAAMRTAIVANNAAIDSIIDALEGIGISAS